MPLSIGLMSGTSMDGIDAALLETDGRSQIKSLGYASISYNPAFKILLKAAEYAVRNCAGDLSKTENAYSTALTLYCEQILQLPQDAVTKTLTDLKQYLYQNQNQTITFNDVIQHSTDLHAQLVNQLIATTHYNKNDIAVVGYHGQTLFHQPAQGISVVVGDGFALAKKLNMTVVNDFRRQDVLAGGQGAPFAPIYHHALAVRDQKIPCVVVNCGGIANVTIINNTDENSLIGFDTGPGNVLLDRLIKKRTQGRAHMDENGEYGKRGQVNDAVLNALFAKAVIKNGQNYFTLPAPKSLDTHDCLDIPELELLSLEDACATLETFTAQSIAQSVAHYCDVLPQHWIIAGGGAYNPVMMEALQASVKQLNPTARVFTADQAGWSIQGLEAEIFAYLAVRSLQQLPLSFPGTTGVPVPMTGGSIHK